MDLKDLTIAINCIEKMQEYGTYQGEEIGIVKKEIPGLCHYPKGKVIIYRRELFPLDSQRCMGEYRGMPQKTTGRVTVESPLCQADIKINKAKGNLITATGTIVFVPIEYIEKVSKFF